MTLPLIESYREIPLTQEQVAVVCERHYTFLSQWKWHAQFDPKLNKFYARRFQGIKETAIPHAVFMHRLLLGLEFADRRHGEHIDGDTLRNVYTDDPLTNNLRVAQPFENARNRKLYKNNTSGFKGAFWIKRDRRWESRIRFEKRLLYLGTSESAIEAARVYDRKAIELFGEFAHLNFPRSDYA
jgi:hypothetical protein